MSETKNRKNSVGSIEEFIYKRKRQELENKTPEKEVDASKRSKKIQRSSKTDNNGENQEEEKPTEIKMDKLEKLIIGLSTQMKEIKEDTSSTKTEINSIKTEINSINTQLKQYGEEIRNIKEDLLKKEVEWKTEKTELNKEIGSLKRKLENQERNRKRNNIIIKGKEFNKLNLKQEVKEFLQQEIGIDADIEETYKVGKPEAKATIVKMQNFDQKLQILKQKRNIRGTEVYIDSDLNNFIDDLNSTATALQKLPYST